VYFLTRQAALQAGLSTFCGLMEKRLTVPRFGHDAKHLSANLTQRGEGDNGLKFNADDVLRKGL
jgi:hypothetical protein